MNDREPVLSKLVPGALVIAKRSVSLQTEKGYFVSHSPGSVLIVISVKMLGDDYVMTTMFSCTCGVTENVLSEYSLNTYLTVA